MLRFNLEFALTDEAFSIAGNQSGKGRRGQSQVSTEF
jgi:hypothetical protein